MLMDGIELLPGARIENASVAYGTTFPSADVGELFFRTTDSILYVYTGTFWDKTSGIPNAENKSSATIRAELTSTNVTNALGFTPMSNSYFPAWSSISEKPTTIAGYGITNAYTKIEIDNTIAGLGSPAWSNVTGKPTLIGSSGITDVYTKTEVNTNITNAVASVSGAGQTVRNTTAGTLATTITPVRMYPSANMTLVNVSASVSTASTGADIKVDIKKNGVSILAGNLITITAGSFKSAVIANTTQITTSDYITVHITQVGSGLAGADLVTSIYFI
jgi:hypothetical protein